MSVGMKEVKINFELRILLRKMEKDICGCKKAKLQLKPFEFGGVINEKSS